MTGYTSNISITTRVHQASQPADDGELKPELADLSRLGRRLVHKAVRTARSEESVLRRVLHDHLGPGAASVPVLSGTWEPYDHVNLQIGLDAWLAGGGRRHELLGITGFRHRDFGLADLVHGGDDARGLRIGNVSTVALPAGPDGATRACVRCGLYLVSDGEARAALLLRSPDQHGPNQELSLEVAAADPALADRILAEVRELALARNVYRGQVISFGGEMFGHHRGGALSFLDRPRLAREQVILSPELLDGIERQVLGVQQHARRLRASGQHLKRGVLLYGVPGTGKTHTVRYLIGEMRQATVVVLSGEALGLIRAACSVARLLQPSVIVIEDVDLIAEQRGPHPGQHPMLFQLLNEMDGLGADVDVTFLLTTNRADILEEALAARPGRVDHAAELPVPDADARRRLVRLYQGQIRLDLSDPEVVISRTEGVTASFLKELLRKAALFAAEDGDGPGPAGPAGADAPLRVTDAHMAAALDMLLDTRNQLTRVLLGGQPGRGTSTRLGQPPMDAEVGVVGAGTMGAMALWRLAHAGIDVLGFEQFTLGHDRSAAGGESRMLRAAEPAMAPVLRRAVELWRELEAETGQRLLTQAGGLVIGAPDSDLVRDALEAARQSARPHEVLDAAAMARRYPQHRLEPGEVGVLDRAAGFVRPEFAVLAGARRAAGLGARILERTPVLRIEPAADGVTVVTPDRAYRVGQLVVAAGPWTAELLPQLTGLIALRRIVLTWYMAADPGQWAPGRCPVFVHLVDGLDLAGFPSLDGGSVKVAASASDSPLAAAGQLDLRVAPEQIEAVNAGVARWLPGLTPRPVRVAAYMDGYTQDGRPLAGPLPGAGNIGVLAGFSGRGFKYAPAVGDAAVRLIRGQDPGLPAGPLAP